MQNKVEQIRHKNKLKQQNFRLKEALEITSSNSLILQMRKLSPEILDYSFCDAMELEKSKMREETKIAQHNVSSRNLNK